MLDAIDEHESVDREHVGQADLTDVITTANLLTHWGKQTQKTVDLDNVPALERLHLTGETAIKKLEESRSEVESIKSALN